MQLSWLREQVSNLEGDYWHQLAVESIRTDLFRFQRLITAEALDSTSEDTSSSRQDVLGTWRRTHENEILRATKVVSEIKEGAQLNLAMLQ